MARSIEFCKQSDDRVKSILEPLLKEYWFSDNTQQIYPVLRIMLNDPIDRRNILELTGGETPWLDEYEPLMHKVIAKKFGDEKPRRNKGW